MSSTEKVAYDANCHCGAVKFTVNIPSLEVEEVTRCNCSICTRNGYLNVFPRREDVVFHSGESQLASYLFGKKRRAHRFCPTCGTSVLIDFQNAESEAERPYMAINVRTFKDIDFDSLKYRQFDGKEKFGPPYQA